VSGQVRARGCSTPCRAAVLPTGEGSRGRRRSADAALAHAAASSTCRISPSCFTRGQASIDTPTCTPGRLRFILRCIHADATSRSPRLFGGRRTHAPRSPPFHPCDCEVSFARHPQWSSRRRSVFASAPSWVPTTGVRVDLHDPATVYHHRLAMHRVAETLRAGLQDVRSRMLWRPGWLSRFLHERPWRRRRRAPPVSPPSSSWDAASASPVCTRSDPRGRPGCLPCSSTKAMASLPSRTTSLTPVIIAECCFCIFGMYAVPAWWPPLPASRSRRLRR
jgi:hypothetical protein